MILSLPLPLYRDVGIYFSCHIIGSRRDREVVYAYPSKVEEADEQQGTDHRSQQQQICGIFLPLSFKYFPKPWEVVFHPTHCPLCLLHPSNTGQMMRGGISPHMPSLVHPSSLERWPNDKRRCFTPHAASRSSLILEHWPNNERRCFTLHAASHASFIIPRTLAKWREVVFYPTCHLSCLHHPSNTGQTMRGSILPHMPPLVPPSYSTSYATSCASFILWTLANRREAVFHLSRCLSCLLHPSNTGQGNKEQQFTPTCRLLCPSHPLICCIISRFTSYPIQFMLRSYSYWYIGIRQWNLILYNYFLRPEWRAPVCGSFTIFEGPQPRVGRGWLGAGPSSPCSRSLVLAAEWACELFCELEGPAVGWNKVSLVDSDGPGMAWLPQNVISASYKR